MQPARTASKGDLCYRVLQFCYPPWQQLDLFEIYEWECPGDGDRCRVIVELKCIFKFLFGLNSSLDDVRGRIQVAKSFPSLRGVYSDVCHEESRRKIMLGPSAPPSYVDASALAAQHPSSHHGDDSGGVRHSQPSHIPGQFKQGCPWCPTPKCRKPTHVLDTCGKIYGKPADWKSARDRRANTAVPEPPSSEQQPFTKA